MKIIKINWISEEAFEAELIVTDGTFNLVCFAYPFKLRIGDEVDLPLFAFNTENIQRSQINDYVAEKHSSDAYYIQGLLVDKHNSLVKVGEFTIEIDSYIPADIEELEFISFICDRLDFKSL